MPDQNQITDYDIAIVGGGINGAGIARDAAGRGYKVLLVEQDDLASHTSSGSSKLIHGGLRYLEYYEFKLVREALNEREVLLNIAPHIIWPLRFVLPHNKKMRPRWMIRAGLWLYDHLGKRKKLPGSNSINFASHQSGQALKREYKNGFEYSDCWVQDARLVVLNAMDARDHGADILTRTCCVSAQAENDIWKLDLSNKQGGGQVVKAKFLVNACGPWVVDFLDNKAGLKHQHSIRLVSGGHIVVPKIFDHDMAYIFQNPDNRIIFAIPYEKDYTLIGTTEIDVNQCLKQTITDNEVDYLCKSVDQYFNKQINEDDVVWHYTGVRPLLDDGSDEATEATREYVLDLVEQPAPYLSVFGGKITTYRSLAENAMEMIDIYFGQSTQAWTGTRPLPGGDLENADFERYLINFRQLKLWLPEDLAHHYVRNYGSRVEKICQNANSMEELGEHFGQGLYQAEVDYLIEYEWAQNPEDILWRRSKWGLKLTRQEQRGLASYISKKVVNN